MSNDYEHEERIALMSLNINNARCISTLASLDLNNLHNKFNRFEKEFIIKNTDKLLINVEKMVQFKWQPIDLFGVFQTQKKWDGLVFRIPLDAHILDVDYCFLYYNTPENSSKKFINKAYGPSPQLFWKI